MKKKIIWKILLLIGLLVFLLPIGLGIYKVQLENWIFVDWLIMYSFLYWYTYIVGIILITISAIHLNKKKKRHRRRKHE